jgi:rhodanese-related sulfurtransferase
MKAESAKPQHACETTEKSQHELDRQVFFLKTLFDASTELAGIIQPRKILDTFLLMAMGPLGITWGVAGLVNSKTGAGDLAGRGLDEAERSEVQGNLPAICMKFFSDSEMNSLPSSRIMAVSREAFEPYGLFPASTASLALWNLSGEYAGFVAFGAKITGHPLDDGDMDLVLHLTHLLTSTLDHALSVLNIQQLNAELVRKNVELEAALGELGSSRDELDRRIFHLRSLSDLNTELSPLFDMNRLLQAFLMTTMGALGVGQGFVLVYDREVRAPEFAARGVLNAPHWDGDACEKLLYAAFDSSEAKSFAPSSISRIANPALFREFGMDIHASIGFFFVVDEPFMGVFGLGPTITSGAFSPEEVDLLGTQISSFIIFLRNARAFEAIRVLNDDLARRNEELSQTIRELTEARDRISILEKARARLRSLLQRETERIGRPAGFDCALILFLATAIGVFFNLAAPQGIPLVQDSWLRPPPATITPHEARRMVEEESAVLVDARPRELYDQRHIEGAVNVPLSLFDIMVMMKLSQIDLERPIIVYGSTISRRYDEELAFRLKQRDHENVKVLAGGVEAWTAQGYRVE